MSALRTFEENLEWGRIRERQLRAYLASKGHHVILVNPEDKNQSPKVHVSNGQIIPAADLICLKKGQAPFWVEVKTKTSPMFFYKGSAWFHGVDGRLWKHYRKLNEVAPVYFAVCEMMFPPSNDFCPPEPPCLNGKTDFSDYKNYLIDGPNWLTCSFDKASENLSASTGSRGKPMAVWPRNIMTRFEV